MPACGCARKMSSVNFKPSSGVTGNLKERQPAAAALSLLKSNKCRRNLSRINLLKSRSLSAHVSLDWGCEDLVTDMPLCQLTVGQRKAWHGQSSQKQRPL